MQKEVIDSSALDACDCYLGFATFMKKDGRTIGTISIDDDFYELEDLGDGENLLVKKENSGLGHKCGMPSIEEGGGESVISDHSVSDRGDSSNCPVKIRALYTDYAYDNVSNLEDKIRLEVKKAIQGLINSDVPVSELKFVLVIEDNLWFYKVPTVIGKHTISRSSLLAMDSLIGVDYNTFLSDGDVVGDIYDIITDDSMEDYIEITELSGDEIMGKFQVSMLLDTAGFLNPREPDTLIFSEGQFHTGIRY